jgi:hypothetical protein
MVFLEALPLPLARWFLFSNGSYSYPCDHRERHWIEELTSLSIFPVLFVLGADHIDSFGILLREHGFTPSTLAGDWQPSPEATQAA